MQKPLNLVQHTPGNQGGGAPKPRKGRDKQKEELQELLIDPTYDPLFDGIGKLKHQS